MNTRATSHKYGYRAPADDGAGGAGGGAGEGGGNGAQPAGAGGAAGGGQGGGQGGAGGGEGAGGQGDATLLAQGGKDGQGGSEGGQGEQPLPIAERIPEKYRVLKADGTLDLEASTAKLAEGLTAANKRIGTGDLPPEKPEDYKPEGLPDDVNLEELAQDELYQEFLKDAHAAGMTNAQVSLALKAWFERATSLVADKAVYDEVAGATALRKVWTDDATFQGNLKHAFRGTAAACAKAGIDVGEIMASPLGNHPQFLRLMAAIGPEVAEDALPGGASISAQDFDSQIAAIRSHPGYTDRNHPEHAGLMAKQRQLYEKRYPSPKR